MIGLKSWTVEDRLTHSYWILKRHLIHPPHEVLKSKLFSYGIGGKTLKWIGSFLCFRQRVVVNGVKSDWAPVLSGVPQGTVLGPLLFSLYINDISSDNESEIRLFADDCVDCRPDGHTLPPLGNFADIPYLKEQSFLHRIRDVCTL